MEMILPRISGKIRSALFDNGLRAYILPKQEAPTVTIQAWVRTGSVHEEEFLGCGLSHFLEHMLFQGTEHYPGNTIPDTVTRLGGYLNAYTAKTHTVFYINLPARHVADGIKMLDDMLRRPLFPEEKFASEKDVILRECAMYEDTPDSVLFDKLALETFLRHPFRHPIIGYQEKIQSVNRKIMSTYHAKRYTPGRIFYVIAGDVCPDAVLDLLGTLTANWNMGSLAEPFLMQEPAASFRKETTVRFADPLPRCASAWQIPPLPCADMAAIELFCDILGGSESSRLPAILKNEKELALDVSTYVYPSNVCGISGFAAAALEQNREKLIEEIFRILADFIKHGPEKHELERAVAQQTADCLRSMRTECGIARMIGNAVLNSGSPEAADEFLPAIRNLKAADLIRTGELYFSPNCATLVHMLPKADATPQAKSRKAVRTMPQPKMKRMKSGQKMIYLPDHTLPLADLYIMLPGGACYEPEEMPGITKLIAATLPAGCGNYSEKELNELLDSHAIALTVTSGTASLRIAVNCPRDQLGTAEEILCELLSAPHFPEKALERERTAIREELKVKLASPDSLAEDLLMHTLFGLHPYGKTLETYLEALSRPDAAAVRKTYRELCLNPQKAIFGISGDLTFAEAEKMISRITAACEWHNAVLPEPPCPSFPNSMRRAVRKLDKAQAVMFLGMPGPSAASPDMDALDILKTASSTMSSRLFQSVRNKNGLAYYTGCTCMPGIGSGCIAYYAGTRADAVPELEKLLLQEINRVVTEGLSKEEFQNAKASILFQLDSAMQSPDKLLAAAVTGEFTGRGFRNILRKREILEKLTRKEVNAAIVKYLSSPSRVLALVMPRN